MAEALPGGFVQGGEAFYMAHSQTTASGKALTYGMAGVVQGPSDEKSIVVAFGDLQIKCALHQIALTQPSLEFAGGYKLDDAVFFKGSTQKVGNGTLEPGCQGTIVGPGGDENVAVKFEALQAPIKIGLGQLCKSEPNAKPPDGVPLGTYIGNGIVDDCSCQYTLRLNEKKIFWLDYKLQRSVATAPPKEQFHAEGRFDIAVDKVKCTFGGLPGQPRQGQVWEFDVVVSGPLKNLMREGVTLKPQSDMQSVHNQKPKEKTREMKLGPYISPDFERTPEGKGLVDTCRYTITLLENEELWLDFESTNKINSSRWHCEGPYEEVSDTKIQYKVKARPYGGGPAVNTELSLDMDVKAGTITYDGQTCAFKAGVTSVGMANVSQDRPEPKTPPQVEPTAPPKVEPPKVEPTAPPKVETKFATTPAATTAAVPSGEALTVDQLKDEQICKSKGVDPARKETYLSDDEFQNLFKMPKAEFAALPKWKQETAKKKHGLF